MTRRIVTLTLLVFWAVVMALTPTTASIPRFLKKATVDLNGDGKKERINLSTNEEESIFCLTVNGVKTSGEMQPPISGFQIIDINTKDGFKEIAVHTSGPSDDDQYWIYGFDVKSIKLLGKLQRRITLNGAGIVLVNDWMGFWWKEDKYVLAKDHSELLLTPKKSYSVGLVATVQKTTPIYKNPNLTGEISTELKPKSKATILQYWPNLNDQKYGRYLIIAPNGLAGWTDLPTISLNFSGLNFAD